MTILRHVLSLVANQIHEELPMIWDKVQCPLTKMETHWLKEVE